MMELSNRAKMGLTLAGVALLAVLVVAFPTIIVELTGRRSIPDGSIPPAFYGNRAAFALSLFAQFSMSSLAIRNMLVTARRLRDDPWRRHPDLGLYRVSRILLNSVIVLIAAPDVLIMTLWGEVSLSAIQPLRVAAQICDGLALVPFFLSTFIVLKADQLEHMSVEAIASLGQFRASGAPRPGFFLVLPRSEGVADHVRIMLFVLVIAAGLAIFK